MRTRERNWGPGQCFAPQMGSSVCEHQCGSWQGLREGGGGDGQIAMAHAPIQMIPGPLQQWRTCRGPGLASIMTTHAGRCGQRLHGDAISLLLNNRPQITSRRGREGIHEVIKETA